MYTFTEDLFEKTRIGLNRELRTVTYSGVEYLMWNNLINFFCQKYICFKLSEILFIYFRLQEHYSIFFLCETVISLFCKDLYSYFPVEIRSWTIKTLYFTYNLNRSVQYPRSGYYHVEIPDTQSFAGRILCMTAERREQKFEGVCTRRGLRGNDNFYARAFWYVIGTTLNRQEIADCKHVTRLREPSMRRARSTHTCRHVSLCA